MQFYHLVRLSYEQGNTSVSTNVLVLAESDQSACEKAIAQNLITSFDEQAAWSNAREATDLKGGIIIRAVDVKRVRPDHVRVLKVYLSEANRGPVAQFKPNPPPQE